MTDVFDDFFPTRNLAVNIYIDSRTRNGGIRCHALGSRHWSRFWATNCGVMLSVLASANESEVLRWWCHSLGMEFGMITRVNKDFGSVYNIEM